MSNLEEKILGEKKQYYCDSSSSEDDEQSKEEEDRGNHLQKCSSAAPSATGPGPWEWDGTSVNTGPKGVLHDWQRFKQLQSEKREQQEAERLSLAKKLSLTCRSNLDEELEEKKQKNKNVNNPATTDEDLKDEEEEDRFFQEYVQKRMEEMLVSARRLPTFGRVLSLRTKDEFLEAVDQERKDVTVIVHLYEDGVLGCEALDGCMQCLCREYPRVKFCRLKASIAGLTKNFKVHGVPALVVYKGGNLVGNFVQMSSELGDDFFAVDLQAFLVENGILQDKSLIPEVVHKSRIFQSSEDNSENAGSDFELD